MPRTPKIEISRAIDVDSIRPEPFMPTGPIKVVEIGGQRVILERLVNADGCVAWALQGAMERNPLECATCGAPVLTARHRFCGSCIRHADPAPARLNPWTRP